MMGWLCKNCGHNHEATESLKELGFKWFDEHTSKIECGNCQTMTLQRVWSYDEQNRPVAGEFLAIITRNRIRKGKN